LTLLLDHFHQHGTELSHILFADRKYVSVVHVLRHSGALDGPHPPTQMMCETFGELLGQIDIPARMEEAVFLTSDQAHGHEILEYTNHGSEVHVQLMIVTITGPTILDGQADECGG
jgi:hypothetical protein